MPFAVALRHVATGFLLAVATTFASPNPPIPPPSIDVPLAKQPGKETAVFAGGCFWGVQSVFQRVKGVLSTTAGYSGGSAKATTYKQVVTETTGHAESVEVIYDPSRITYGQLLRIYFSVAHDPTQLNRLLCQRRPEATGAGVHCAARSAEGFSKAYRDRSDTPKGVLSRRRLSSGLRLLQSGQSIYSSMRSPENCGVATAVSGTVCGLQTQEVATGGRDKRANSILDSYT